MRNFLQQLEKSIQRVVERIPGIFQKDDHKQKIVYGIINKFQEQAIQAKNSQFRLANRYQIVLSAQDYDALQQEQNWLSEVSNLLTETTVELGLEFSGPLEIFFSRSDVFLPGEFDIILDRDENLVEQTTAMQIDETKTKTNLPENAFLLLPDRSVFPLDRGIIQIGRSDNNHLVLKHKTISRNHVQIRAKNGKFIIFDLDSSGGTYLNGIRITQAQLSPGDVITLADYPMVYGEDEARIDQQQDQTTELPRYSDKP